jgi:hypothetical protein
VRIIIRGDGSPDFSGGKAEEVLRLAEIADTNLQRWIELMSQKIRDQESEQAVDRAVEARKDRAFRSRAFKGLPQRLRELAEAKIRALAELERERLRKGEHG